MYDIISLVVYIYYKCTIWLQYKDSFRPIPLGITIWIIEQIETIVSMAKTKGQ